MSAGKLFLTGLLALLLAFGASSTGAARSSYSVGFSTGPAWGAYPVYPAYPAYYYPPAPIPVGYPRPYYYPTAYPVYPAGPTLSFGFSTR